MAEELLEGAMSLTELSLLSEALDRGQLKNPLTEKVFVALRSASTISRSFRRGGDGPPDFTLVHTVMSSLVAGGMAMDVMDAISSALASADLLADFGDGPGGTWVLVALAAALPLLHGALPKDKRGLCVLPHEHRMQEHQADLEGIQAEIYGSIVVYNTHRMCDRCMEHIHDRVYFHCDKGCDVDFCLRCHDELQGVLEGFAEDSGAGDRAAQRMLWSVHVTDQLAHQLLSRGPDDRKALAELLTYEWPTDLFLRVIRAVVDVCNARVLYNDSKGALTSSVDVVQNEHGEVGFVQRVTPIYDDLSFWHSLALLQFLYACNSRRRGPVVDGAEILGPRIACEEFVLEGINKCKPAVEWERWLRHHGSSTVIDILNAECFLTSDAFRSLIAHNNVLPISFRRHCLLADLWSQMEGQRTQGHLQPIQLDVDREPQALVKDVVGVFARAAAEGGSSDAASGGAEKKPHAWGLRQPLKVAFKGEEARGPGVLREFFQVALRAFLATLFTPNDHRTYWFSEEPWPEGFFACGVMLGQAILHNEGIPQVFPPTFFELLLRDFASPHCQPLGLPHLAAVSPVEASSLQQVLDHEGEDIASIYGDLGWERTHRLEGIELTQATKAAFVDAYVQWSLTDRIRIQLGHFSDGFRAVLGESVMLREMVDAVQLERILCGGDDAVDVAALQSRAKHEGWSDAEAEYLEAFWAIVADMSEAVKRRFLLFLTASDRVPLEGWEHLRVVVQRNGDGDERLPTAFTCFNLMLLPKYSSASVLSAKLHAAITNSEGFGLR
mmetsp:Transcript_41618/g.114743  ORF Transcript_41618/g.114743 Transcript_41618/m.114743 type:complete len:782 (+) Transcript_41618:58-2403(+)